MENKIDITKLKAQDFMNELPEMVRSLEAVRSGSQDKKPVGVTFGELVTGKWGISEDGLFEKMGINPKVDTMQNIFTMHAINALPQCLHSFISQSESVSIKEKHIWIMTSREWKFHTITGAFSANEIW